jgi:hypothetical protein
MGRGGLANSTFSHVGGLPDLFMEHDVGVLKGKLTLEQADKARREDMRRRFISEDARSIPHTPLLRSPRCQFPHRFSRHLSRPSMVHK